MANHLTPFVEFMGLSGCGKSFFSHMVAESLRREGVKVCEPSWELDHLYGKYARVLKKELMASWFSLFNKGKAQRLDYLIKKCGYTGSDYQKLKLNLLYKAYILTQKQDTVVFFDEGLSQMAVSLAMGGKLSAKSIYDEMLQILTVKGILSCVKIDCSIENAMENMEKRETHDSRVEKMTSEEDKIRFMRKFEKECNSIDVSNLVSISYSDDTDGIVQVIKDRVKAILESK